MTLSRNERWFTWYGHYLYSGELFLIFYIVNMYYCRRILDKKEPVYIFLISIAAILMVGSKTCTALILSVFILSNVKKPSYSVAGVFIIYIMYHFGAFDLVISRFDANNISTGRVEAIQYLLERNNDLFPIFLGNGTNYIEILKKSYVMASAGFEFVLLQFATFFGCVFTVVLGMIIFIKPIFRSIFKRDFILIISVIAIIMDVNSYNGLACFQDHMYAYAWVISILFVIESKAVSKNNNLSGGLKWKNPFLT